MSFGAWAILKDRVKPNDEATFGRFIGYGLIQWANKEGVICGMTKARKEDATFKGYTESFPGDHFGEKLIEDNELAHLNAQLDA